MPTRILDLHTHLFNARYLPLEGIIADLMKKDRSALGNVVARLLYRLTDSAYEPDAMLRTQKRLIDHPDSDPYAEAIWWIAEKELIATTKSLDLIEAGRSSMDALQRNSVEAHRIAQSELMQIIQQLDAVDYAAEGWVGDDDAIDPEDAVRFDEKSVGSMMSWAERVVKRALRRLAKLMDSEAWGTFHNYIEFFFTLLGSETEIVKRLEAGYGEGLPPMQFVHFMMDMQMAFPAQIPPYYAVYPEQMRRMDLLQRSRPAQVFGFWAFDPRRREWKTWAKAALDKGFAGFKFYPAMGYKPDGDAAWGDVIEEFYAFCVEHDAPVFAHCTPEGFQTKKQEGYFANPKYWEGVLKRWPTLRLCLGHAGGGDAGKGEHHSYGWDAIDHDQWTHDNNYAQRVVTLCKTYPNVYCEVGHLVELLNGGGRQRFLDNLARANAAPGPYDFMDKMAYGTDWHMQAMVNSTRRFLDALIAMFQDPALAAYSERFFWKNAYRYLKLSE